jgi:hypothetical protein
MVILPYYDWCFIYEQRDYCGSDVCRRSWEISVPNACNLLNPAIFRAQQKGLEHATRVNRLQGAESVFSPNFTLKHCPKTKCHQQQSERLYGFIFATSTICLLEQIQLYPAILLQPSVS